MWWVQSFVTAFRVWRRTRSETDYCSHFSFCTKRGNRRNKRVRKWLGSSHSLTLPFMEVEEKKDMGGGVAVKWVGPSSSSFPVCGGGGRGRATEVSEWVSRTFCHSFFFAIWGAEATAACEESLSLFPLCGLVGWLDGWCVSRPSLATTNSWGHFKVCLMAAYHSLRSHHTQKNGFHNQNWTLYITPVLVMYPKTWVYINLPNPILPNPTAPN